MTRSTLRSHPITHRLLAVLGVIAASFWLSNQVVQAQEQVLYLSIVDSSGTPITDVDENEIVVQWDGEDTETLEFEQPGWPLRVTVFIDNSNAAILAVPQMREGLRAFLAELPGEVEVGLATIAGRAQWVAEHTADRAELERGIGLIVPNTGSSADFLDALIEEGGRLDDDNDREYYPVIVMLSADGVEGSSSQQGRFDEMVNRMIMNSAEVHTLFFVSGQGSGAAAIQVQIGEALAQNTRGSFERFAAASGFVNLLTELARDLANKHRMVSNQYRVTYRQPRNPSAQPAIGVATTRDGLNLIPTLDGNVPARMPQP